MPQYELLFGHDLTLEDDLNRGNAYRWHDEVWRVEDVEQMEGQEAPRVYLKLWPTDVPHPRQIKGHSP